MNRVNKRTNNGMNNIYNDTYNEDEVSGSPFRKTQNSVKPKLIEYIREASMTVKDKYHGKLSNINQFKSTFL